MFDCVLLFNRPSPLRYIRGGWTSRARKRLGFTSKTLVKFGLVLSELSKTVRFKLAAPCGSFLWWYMISDENESKSNLDRFDDTNNFDVERFLIKDHLKGQIARATNQTWRLVGRAIFRLVTGLHSGCSNFCIRTRIWTFLISKSIVSTRRRQSV